MRNVNNLLKKFSQSQQSFRQSSTRWVTPTGEPTGIQIYNCITRSKTPLISNNKVLTWYTCGPTVYDSTHIGHACTYIRNDVLQRILKNYFKLTLITVSNITDIDDKIIKRSLEEHVPYENVARRYEKQFWDDLRSFGISKPMIVCRVSESIPQILSFIHKLLRENMAYVSKEGSVYFDTGAYNNYHKLVNSLVESVRDDEGGDKKRPEDFALWKAVNDDGPYWESPWGHGRPGWHIECSVMASMVRILSQTQPN